MKDDDKKTNNKVTGGLISSFKEIFKIPSNGKTELEHFQDTLLSFINISNTLTSELDFDRLFPLIIEQATEVMAAERTSLYLIDWESKTIGTKVAQKIDQIRLPIGKGICGRVAQTGGTINAADARDLDCFDEEFDIKHDFITKSVLCLPINNRAGERIGVIQVINKKNADRFDARDELLLKGLTSQIAIALENSILVDELRVSFERSISTLSATVDARHPLTAGHSARVTQYCMLIADQIGLSNRETEVLKYAAILHDIGKIGVRDNILLKNGPFTPEEREEMNTHTTQTESILNNFHFPKNLHQVPEIAARHHERIDGRGYPYGLRGEQIPLGSKIMAVADVFDALTSKRDYPKYTKDETFNNDPMPLGKAITILKDGAGTQFSPEVVESFIQCLPQALLMYRGEHFPPQYIDDTIRELAPHLLAAGE